MTLVRLGDDGSEGRQAKKQMKSTRKMAHIRVYSTLILPTSRSSSPAPSLYSEFLVCYVMRPSELTDQQQKHDGASKQVPDWCRNHENTGRRLRCDACERAHAVIWHTTNTKLAKYHPITATMVPQLAPFEALRTKQSDILANAPIHMRKSFRQLRASPAYSEAGNSEKHPRRCQEDSPEIEQSHRRSPRLPDHSPHETKSNESERLRDGSKSRAYSSSHLDRDLPGENVSQVTMGCWKTLGESEGLQRGTFARGDIVFMMMFELSYLSRCRADYVLLAIQGCPNDSSSCSSESKAKCLPNCKLDSF